jgi:hypothetical protein
MTVYVYGLTHTDVAAEELAFLQTVDTTRLTAAIERTAADLNIQLRSLGVDPTEITSSAFPDDFEWCRSTVMYGAAGFYLRNSTGSEEAATVKMATFGSRVRMFNERPQMLVSYQSTKSGALTVRGPGNYGDPAAAERARARFLDPSYVTRWRQ